MYDFPASPTENQEYTPPGALQTYVWKAPRWVVSGVPPLPSTGPQGPIGPTGPQGDTGPTGPQGVKGDTGSQGVPGTPGATGATGSQGPQGVKGDTGATGAQGPIGPTGPQGAAGTGINVKGTVPNYAGLPSSGMVDGDAYITSDTNHLWIWDTPTTTWIDAGNIQGPPGAVGPTGPQGVKGDTGAQGPQGVKGDTGLTGATGAPGATGATGTQGPQGVKGDTGATGTQGPAGTIGPQGPQGLKGDTGATGAAGADGSPDTAAQVLAKLITVDGAASLLDADLLDGQQGAHYLDWTNFTSKPSTFPPTAHTHAQSEITNLVTDLSGKAPTVHTHVQSDITGLAASFAAKEPTIAAGTTAQYWRGDKSWQTLPTMDWTSLPGKPTVFPPSAHVHPIADVTGLQTVLDGKALTVHTHLWADITDKPLTFAPSTHTHLWADITDKPSTFAPSAHDHTRLLNGSYNATLDGAGLLTTNNGIRFAYSLESSGTSLAIGTTGNGTIFLRPQGISLTAGEFHVAANGNTHTSGSANVVAGMTIGSNVLINGGYAINTAGSSLLQGIIQLSGTGTAAQNKMQFANGSASAVGFIQTSGAATAYITSSDANLKTVSGEINPLDAVDIIRADPVLTWTWKESGETAIGWVAQKSYAVDPNLACPPPAPGEGEVAARPGEPGYSPWGIDYGRRTPYLWAALSWALDKIDALEARLTAVEGTPP
jgi:hypothetical protein